MFPMEVSLTLESTNEVSLANRKILALRRISGTYPPETKVSPP